MAHSQNLKNYSYLALAQLMVGINIVGSKFLAPSVSILFLLTIRFCLSTLLLLTLHFLISNKESVPTCKLSDLTRKDWGFIAAQALTAGIFFNFLMIWGLQYTDANLAGIITSALPALTVLMSCLVFRQKFTSKIALCIGFATLGLIVIGVDKLNNGFEMQNSFLGILIILLALIPEASYYVISKWHSNRLPIFLLSALLNGINAVILIPIFLLQTHLHLENPTLAQWLVLIIIGVVSGLFYVFWYLGSTKVEAVKASLSTALMPIATVIMAWLFLGELISFTQLVGMSLVILSIIFYVFS